MFIKSSLNHQFTILIEEQNLGMATGDQVILKNNWYTVTSDRKGKKKSNKRFVVFGKSRNGKEYFFRVYKDHSEKILKHELCTKPDNFCGTIYGQYTQSRGSFFKKNVTMNVLTILDKNGSLRFEEEVERGSIVSPMKESLKEWNQRIRKAFEWRWEYEVKSDERSQDLFLMTCTERTLSITSQKKLECINQWPIIGCRCRAEENLIYIKSSQEDSQDKEDQYWCKDSKDIVNKITRLETRKEVDSESDDDHVEISKIVEPKVPGLKGTPDISTENKRKKRCTPPATPRHEVAIDCQEKHTLPGKKKMEENKGSNHYFNFEPESYTSWKPSQRCSVMRRYGSDCMLNQKEENMDEGEDYLDMTKNAIYHSESTEPAKPANSTPGRKSKRKSLIRKEIKVKSVAPLDLEMVVPVQPKKNEKNIGYMNIPNARNSYINMKNDDGFYDSVPTEESYINVVDQVEKDQGERNSMDILYSRVDDGIDDDIFDVNKLASAFYDYENKEEIYKLIRMRDKKAQYVNTLPRAGWGCQPSRDSQDYTIVRRSGTNCLLKLNKRPIPQPRVTNKTKLGEIDRQVNVDETNIDDDTAWSDNICFTLESILKRRPPNPDTLGLSRPARVMLCYSLYTVSPMNPTSSSWHDLADAIGLSYEASNIITNFIFQHPSVEVAAEIVIRHWQFAYNKYGVGDNCLEPCTPEGLKKILSEKMKRYDLIHLIE